MTPYRVLLAVLLLFVLPSGYVHPLETRLLQVLTNSPAGREADIISRIEYLEARSAQQRVTPSLYLAAPTAYRVEVPPEGRHVGEAQMGVRGRLPYGATADLSWDHRIEYLRDVEDFAGVPQTGFLQTVSVQADITAPMYYNGAAFLDVSIAHNIRRQADVDRARARNELVRQYVEDYFSIYRERLSVSVREELVVHARTVVAAYEELTERGEAALHELWQAQRELSAREREYVHADIELQRREDLFLSEYGVRFPDEPEIPAGPVDWTDYGILPRTHIEERRMVLSREAGDLRYRDERTDSAPRVNVGVSLSGPEGGEAREFGRSFADQFETFEDWTPAVSIGVSMSTDEFRSASLQRARHELAMERTELEQSRTQQELLAQLRQLERLREQNQRIYEREQETTNRMRDYLLDMELRHESGELDLLELNEIRAQSMEMQAALRATETHITEAELLIELWGRLP